MKKQDGVLGVGQQEGMKRIGSHDFRLCNAGPVALVNSAGGWQIDECLETNFLIKTKILISIKMK